MGMFNPDKEEEEFFGNLYLKCHKKYKPMTKIHGSKLVLMTNDFELFRSLQDVGRDLEKPAEILGRKWFMERTEVEGAQEIKCEMVWVELIEIPAQAGVGRPTASGTLSDPEEEAPSTVE